MKARITVNNYGNIKGNFNIYGLRSFKTNGNYNEKFPIL